MARLSLYSRELCKRAGRMVAGVRSDYRTGSAAIKELRKGDAELKRANEILKVAASFFAAEPGRPLTRS
ncbi:hypothetical protein ACIGBL_34805 [Streptomyces sp. NPDC085614]|uniref:hypothetical protein n=1 Tax=Streptomyces sp. NPDC085614 TaxID=3365733 RepID=UPI0037D96D70